MSRPTMAFASRSILSVVVTHEHACSALFSTGPQLTCGDGELGEPDNSSPATPRSTAPKNPGAGTALPGAMPPGMLGTALCTTKTKHGPPVTSSG
jgi:hypothetical protein